MKKSKIVLIAVASFVGLLALGVAVPFIIFGVRTASINADYSYLEKDVTYSKKAEVANVSLVTQKVSCGYATIEMLSSYYGNKVSEADLDRKNNGGVSTASSDGFLKEVNECIPSKSFVKRNYLKHDELLKEIHDSLEKNNPVAIEWAAKYENEWTLHFSVVKGLDLGNNNVSVLNPYGYEENIPVAEFIGRTSFESFEGMPLFLNFGFAFGAFDKNTIFYASAAK